ncbi:MAG: hypothetical protein OQL06_09050 [Gammaproteobacteria bacterium]|nr:hypothetical protein [Gammaproteobacteria bacterium]
MKVTVDDRIKAKAKVPHNLFMLNLALFHLLMTPATIAMNIGMSGMLLPLFLSLSVIAYTWKRSTNENKHEHWFIFVHWKLAAQRCRMLLVSYLVAAGLLALGWLLALNSTDSNMQDIIQTVFIRIAIMPVLLMVMINFYLESSAINQVASGEIPDAMVKRFPQP